MGKLIVLEGLDGSGKSTQLDLLEKSLNDLKINIKKVSFPEYERESSAPVRMYLNGEFGSNPNDVNAYAASVFYAVDRYASFKLSWEDFYNNGGTVISGRYTTSNIIHQCSKLRDEEKENFINWLYDLEFEKMAIPKPDLVIFLDMPIEVSQKLLLKRYKGEEAKKDIHEKDTEYLKICRKTALLAAEKLGWFVVECSKNGEAKTIEEISNDILKKVKEVIK